MMNKKLLPAVLLSILLLAGCAGQDTAVEEPDAPERDRAAVATAKAAEFRSTLMTALKEGLADGPEQAIGACSIRAPELAAELSVEGIRIGRTSAKLRNPANAPEPWLVPLLEEYQAAGPGAEPRSVDIDADTLGYVEPLYVGEPCLTCHGALVDDMVWQQIDELYPEDQATGYDVGDFRGLLWVTVSRQG